MTFKPSGDHSIGVVVYVKGDRLVEPDETFAFTTNVTSGPAANMPAGGNVALGTIVNDDAADDD